MIEPAVPGCVAVRIVYTCPSQAKRDRPRPVPDEPGVFDYHEDLWKEYTGRTLQELGEDWKASLSK